MGTALTYQGNLNQTSGSTGVIGQQPSSGPVTGVCDFRFSLWDAVTNGNPVGATLTNSAVSVSNGLFTVTLDFGAGAFNGDARWLDIGVRTNGSGAFTELVPRQLVPLVPDALYAAEAGSVFGLTNLSGLQPATANLTNWSNIGTNQFAGTNFASATANGILFSNNWSSFNNKQTALTYQPATNLGPIVVSQLPYVPQPATANLTNWSNIGTNQFLGTNQLPALTNRFQTTNVNLSQWSNIGTNQFAGTNFASATANGILFSNDWSSFNNKQTALGFVPQPATANLTNWSNIGTNQFLGTNALPALTNGFVTASITNGLQTTNVNLSQWSNIGTNQFAGTNFASATVSGILWSNDWQSFNAKQAALGFAPQPASAALTNLASGNGSGLTNLNATNLTGILPLSNLDSAVVTNGIENFHATIITASNFVGDLIIVTNFLTVSNFSGISSNLVLSGTTLNTGIISNGIITSVAITNANGAGITNIPFGNITGLGGAATNSASAFQPASPNLTNWSNIGTNQFAGTNFASSTANGILFSNDWSSFNNKQTALTYQPATNGGPVAVSQLPYAPQPASATLTNLSGITTNQIVFTNVNLSQWSNIGTNQFLGTNALPALTNGFVTASITNGLQTTNVNLSQWSGVSTNQYNGTVSNIFLGMSTGVVFTALQPITTATKYTFAHGLSHTPYFFDVQMVCTNQDDATGYLPGAVLQWGDVVKNNLTGQVSCDATNVYLTLTANLNGNWTLVSVVPFGGGTAVNMTSSTNWNLRAAAQ